MARDRSSWTLRSLRRRMSLVAAAGTLLALAAPAHAGDGTFTAAPATALGFGPWSAAVADLTGDGNPDLVTADYIAKNVSVLLGNGAGGFVPSLSSPLALVNNPIAVAVADVNGDGDQDAVVANRDGNSVSVLLGNGAGVLAATPGTPPAVGQFPTYIAATDLDNDGHEDVIAGNVGGKSISVLLGDGAGGFAAHVDTAIGFAPNSLAVGDVNGDGKQDVMTADFDADRVAVLLGDGAGGLTPVAGPGPGVGTDPVAVAVGDVNGDGNLDLATANFNGASVSVLLGDGTGGFTAAPLVPLAAGTHPAAVAVADLNDDGRQDLATANKGTPDTVSVLLGDGTGRFRPGPGAAPVVGDDPGTIVAADLNQDASPDLVTADSNGKSVSVLLANGPFPGAGNLLANPGAEGPGATGVSTTPGPAFPGWTRTEGAPTFVRYATPGFASLIDAPRWAGGAGFFSGGIGPSAIAQQTVAVADRTQSIDAGLASARLSGLLGGFLAQNDAARVAASFLGAAGQTLGAPLTIGPVTAADRKNQTVLVRRTATAAVPQGTRSIRVTMTMTRAAGVYDDASLDDLSLRLTASVPPAPPAPPVATGLLTPPRPLCRGRRATIVATTTVTRGTRGPDVIVGRPGRDVIHALGGADLVCGRGGADLLDGGAGRDTLLGQAGRDVLRGGAGRDLLLGGAGRDLLRGGLGRDRLVGGPGIDRARQ